MTRRIIITALLYFMWLPAAGATLQVTRVSCDPVSFDPSRGGSVTISYRLSHAATTWINIYDGRDILVRRLLGSASREAGDHEAVWDGKDEAGTVVPPSFYVYTVSAASDNVPSVTHDLSDLTGGKVLDVKNVHYDVAGGTISYVLPEPAIVNVRVGLGGGGPLIATVVDWVPQKGGLHRAPWDGWDRLHVVNVAQSKALQVHAQAYALPQNSIIVTSTQKRERPAFIRHVTWKSEKRQKKSRHRKEMYNHWQHPRDRCYDPKITVTLPGHGSRHRDGTPVISGPVPIRMEIGQADRSFMLDQRFEVVYYVDFVFVYEEELGYTPFNWIWNPTGLNEGIHYITVMLRGYEGHFGTATLKVFVKTGS